MKDAGSEGEVTTGICLENIQKFYNEIFSISVITFQRQRIHQKQCLS